MHNLIFKLFLCFVAMAAGPARVEDDSHVRYTLKELKHLRIAKYSAPTGKSHREYFRLQNATGTHYLIYNEDFLAPTMPELVPLRANGGKKVSCNITLNCSTHAFCTGTCKNFYYELSNTPVEPSRGYHNQCAVEEVHCVNLSAAGGK